MKSNTLLLIFAIVMASSIPAARGGQARYSAEHSLSNKSTTLYHAKYNLVKQARSRDNRRITSGIYFPPRRGRSHGYGGIYGHGTGVRRGLHRRHSGHGYKHYYQPYYSPYGYSPRRYNSFYIHGDIPPVYENHRVVVHDQVEVVRDTTINAANQEKLISKVLRDITSQRLIAVRELASYPNIASVAVLIDALINDASAKVRKAAAKSLGEIYDPAAYEALLRSERYDHDELVRNAAELAVDEIRYNNDPKVLPANPVLNPMNDGRAKLGDVLEEIRFGRADQRQDAVRYLDRYQGTQAVAALIDTLINDPDEYVRKEAAYRLGKIQDPLAIPFLEAAASDDLEKIVQRTARKALGKVPESE